MPRPAIIAVSVFAIAVAWAQEPVPLGDPAVRGAITGTVLDESGAAIPGAEVSAVSDAGRVVTVTGADGSFRLVNLQPGRYTLAANLAGFATQQVAGIVVAPGRAQTVTLRFRGGPVPDGEPRPPSPTPRPSPVPEGEPLRPPSPGPSPSVAGALFEVVQHSAATDVELQAWLNQQSAAGRELASVIPDDAGRSYFVFAVLARPTAPQMLVIPVMEGLSVQSVGTRLGIHPRRRLVGVHRLAAGFLMIFTDAQ